MKQTIWTPSEIEIMKRALPAIDAVPAPQDECWPGDAGHDECQLRDHAASLAAVAATAGVSWEFGGWARTARMFRDLLAAIALPADRFEDSSIDRY